LFSLIPCRDPKRPRLRLRIACLGWPLYAYPYIYRHLPREDKREEGEENEEVVVKEEEGLLKSKSGEE
jgi:hypothetical protein